MGHILMLSWLITAQVEARRGKLTLLWGLRGANLKLKGSKMRNPQGKMSKMQTGCRAKCQRCGQDVVLRASDGGWSVGWASCAGPMGGGGRV